MGLISKIENKLHKDSGDASQQEKTSYDDRSGDSHLRHPVSSAGTTQEYGSSTTGTSGSHGYGSSTTGSSAMPGSYDDAHNRDRDGYGKVDPRAETGGLGNSNRSQDPRQADPRDPAYGSSGRHHDPRDAVPGAGHSGPREPYDPYSSKGQTTAANAATGYPGDTTRGDYGGGYSTDPSMDHSRGGMVPQGRNPDAIPTAGGQTVGSSNVNDPYSSSTTTGRHDPYTTSTQNSAGHPIRDAAMAGGAGGAAGYGASGHDERHGLRDHVPGMSSGNKTSSNPNDVSYMNRSEPGMGGPGGMTSGGPGGIAGGSSGPAGMTSGGPGGIAGGSSGPTGMDPRKMGGAYEAGYRDAMEHAKNEMGRQ